MRSLAITLLIGIAAHLAAAQANPVPLVNQPLVPASVAPGGPGFMLTVNGTGFTTASSVHWNGASLATTVVSSERLRATVPAAKIAKPGTASVTVVTPGTPASNTVFFPVAATQGTVGLSQSTLSSFGYFPVAADLNHDRRLDLSFRDLDILLGKGDGTFRDIGGSCGSGRVVFGDFNDDGNLDAAVPDSVNLDICLGDGTGRFVQASTVKAGAYPQVTVAGDFNGDGKLDLITANFYISAALAIMLGNGDGTFQAGVGFGASSFGYYYGLAIGDFNDDGALDIVTADSARSNLSVFLGNGDGTFQEAVTYAGGFAPEWPVVADWNLDGHLDVAVANYAGNVSVLLGEGDGTFASYKEYTATGSPGELAAGDMNNDGRLDLVVVDSYDNLLSILTGNGDGTFQSPTQFPATNYPYSLTLGDFDRDGRLDIVTSSGDSNPPVLALQSARPHVDLTPTSIDFGDESVGIPSPPQIVTLTNTGAATLTIEGIGFTGTDASDFSQSNTCGANILPGASCTISLVFTPTETGARSASLNITDNADGSPQTVSLTGTGTAATVTLSVTDLSFAIQLVGSTSSGQNVILTNTGTGTLTISSIVASGDFSQSNTCGSSLAVGASCTITVRFSPTQKGPRAGTVTITDNAPNSPQTVSLIGVGTVVRLSAIGLNFGDQKVGTASRPLTVTLTNISGQTLSLESIGIVGMNASDFTQASNCGSTVAPHGSCTIRVTFTPTATGARSAVLAIRDNGGGSPQTVTLSGNGT